jgi:small conductance mechanosensitive channel
MALGGVGKPGICLLLRWLMILLLALGTSTAGLAQESSDPGVPEAEKLAKQDPAVAEEVRNTAQQDSVIQQRLAARFARVEALDQVSVEVASGLVTLKGVVDDEAHRELAEKLAEKIDGVIAVNNRLQVDTALNRRLAPVLADGLDRLRRLIIALPLLVVAGFIVWLMYLLGRLATHWHRPFARLRNPFLADLLRSAVRLVFLAAGIMVALSLLGATSLVSAVLGAAGIAGLALGFAFRDLVENYIAGVLLSLRQPFAPNDHVVIDGHEGRVATLTSRATSLITLDGNHLRLPNALVFKGVILNYTRNPTRMFSFDLPLIPEADLVCIQKATIQALKATPGVISVPPPGALVTDLTATGASLTCSGWLDQRESNFYKVKSEALKRVRLALDDKEALPDLVKKVELTNEDAGTHSEHEQQQVTEAFAAADRLAAQASDDFSAEIHLNDQVETERRTLARQNLLRRDAPRE